jgi:hypothetical protein
MKLAREARSAGACQLRAIALAAAINDRSHPLMDPIGPARQRYRIDGGCAKTPLVRIYLAFTRLRD